MQPTSSHIQRSHIYHHVTSLNKTLLVCQDVHSSFCLLFPRTPNENLLHKIKQQTTGINGTETQDLVYIIVSSTGRKKKKEKKKLPIMTQEHCLLYEAVLTTYL